MKIATGTKGLGQGTKGQGQGQGLGAKGRGQGEGIRDMGQGLGLRESKGKEGLERSMITGVMGTTMGVEGKTGLGLPTLRAISCDQLTFALQRECYSIPVLQVQEHAWTVEITPTLQMPGYARGAVQLPGKVARVDMQLNETPTTCDNPPV